MIVTTAPRASSGLASAPDLGASVEHDGWTKPELLEEMNRLDLPLVNRAIDANTIATPQSLPPSSITDSDVAIVGRSLGEPNTEHPAAHPPDPSRYMYDMV